MKLPVTPLSGLKSRIFIMSLEPLPARGTRAPQRRESGPASGEYVTTILLTSAARPVVKLRGVRKITISGRPCARSLSCFEGQGIIASGGEGGDERLARQVANDRRNEPAQAGGNVARQRDGFALDVYTAVALFETPVGIEPPEESVILSDGQRALAGTAGVGYLGDAGAVGTAAVAGGVHGLVTNIVLRIECYGDDLFLAQAQVHLEVVAGAAEEPGIDDLGTVGDLVAIVILDRGDDVRSEER